MKLLGRVGALVRDRRVRAPGRASAARLCLGLLCSGAGGAALAQQRPVAPEQSQGAERSPGWQRQQPAQERARELMRQEGVLPSAEERREELRTLNEIYRDLMPPGPGTVLAPGLAPEPGPRGER